MIYYTGDIHGDAAGIADFAIKHGLTENDTIVILGDVGANYFGDRRDLICKDDLNRIRPTILCIHGNHEKRPASIPSYKLKEWNGGMVWYEDAFPKILFARDGEIFDLDGIKHIAIGGAYSVDKYYRLKHHYAWFSDEQPSNEIKEYVERQLKSHKVDVILAHTCPFKYEPREAFLASIDQSTVDDSTERWLDGIEEETAYKAWLCGHWHIDKRIDKVYFLFDGVTTLDMIRRCLDEED